MFELIGMGLAADTADKIMKAVSAGMDIATAISLIGGITAGIGAIEQAIKLAVRKFGWRAIASF